MLSANRPKPIEIIDSRYSQLMRVMAVINTLSSSENGMGIEDVHREVNAQVDAQWARRTIVRDLDMLVSIGYCSVTRLKRIRLYVINRVATDDYRHFANFLFPF